MPEQQPDLAALVATAAAERPDAVAVVEASGRSLTWAALEEEVARVATGLGCLSPSATGWSS
jgi:long-chain acyl-CoA synthetase